MSTTLREAFTQDRVKIINKMSDAADEFYRSATTIGAHQWLELTGLMRELIKIYAVMLREGLDPLSNAPLPKGHHMEYIAEKLDCIFGNAMREHHDLTKAFVGALQAKGWPVRYARTVT